VFAIRANHVFDGEDFRAVGGTVLVEDRRIVGVESAAHDPPSDCQLVDYGDATMLPGLIDTYVQPRLRPSVQDAEPRSPKPAASVVRVLRIANCCDAVTLALQ
jgi:N-acetylglucosamine-6-phosphate deacetylase